jgi:localization factor PodJL
VPTTDELPAAIGGARLRNAAVAGDPAAAYEVAMRFMEGRGVPANLEEAARWYERAASKGLVPAQFRYASMLEKGQGVKKDLAAAQKLYVAAASKGHAKAMHNLAVLYAEGVDGKPDYANSAQWFRRAAEHGVADSQYNLGVLTARGLGTDKNIAESYKWFTLAAAQGDRDASRKRDDVAAYLNAQTLAAVQEAVKSFAVQPQPAEATVVPEPPGGWDRAAPSPRKPRSSGPLSLGDFNSGKL